MRGVLLFPGLRPALLSVLLLVILPARAEVSDQLVRSNFRSSICNIDSMTVKFKIDEAFGEPIMTSAMRWNAGPNTAPDCLSRLTYIWLRARTPEDELRYVKLSPDITASGEDFGPTATESPNWSSLFCNEPRDFAMCDDAITAKTLFRSTLRIEGFDVATEARTLSGLSDVGTTSSQRRDGDGDDALDSLLADAINEALAPVSKHDAPGEPEEAVAPQPTPEEIAAHLRQQKMEHARKAVNNVVTLIASSLAQFKAPAHACESDRVIANWVQARGTCQLNLRSEANHRFLCSDDGEPKPVRATRSANIDLATDLERIAPIRVSDEGWASVVLELRDELRSTSEGNYKTNRWHFTSTAEHLDDLKRLADSILTLKQYCEAEAAS